MNIAVWIIVGLIAGGFAGKAIKADGVASFLYLLAGIGSALAGVWLASLLFGAEFLARVSVMTVAGLALGALTLVFVLRRLPDRTRA